jgi:hypothetical protein
MINKNYTLALKIKNMILSTFPSLDICIYFDDELNEYIISTRNKEIYYSNEYGKLVFEINQEILWEQGIFNFYFILDESERESDKLAKGISFSQRNEVHYTSWVINNTHSLTIDRYDGIENYSLAA